MYNYSCCVRSCIRIADSAVIFKINVYNSENNYCSCGERCPQVNHFTTAVFNSILNRFKISSCKASASLEPSTGWLLWESSAEYHFSITSFSSGVVESDRKRPSKVLN